MKFPPKSVVRFTAPRGIGVETGDLFKIKSLWQAKDNGLPARYLCSWPPDVEKGVEFVLDEDALEIAA